MYKKELKEIIRYGFFGLLTTFLNIILLKLFIESGINYILSNSISYIIAVIVNYIVNKNYVFENSAKGKSKETQEQFIKFFIMRVCSLILDNILFYLCISILKYSIYKTRVVLTLLIIMLTFIFNKFFIFISKKEKE